MLRWDLYNKLKEWLLGNISTKVDIDDLTAEGQKLTIEEDDDGRAVLRVVNSGQVAYNEEEDFYQVFDKRKSSDITILDKEIRDEEYHTVELDTSDYRQLNIFVQHSLSKEVDGDTEYIEFDRFRPMLSNSIGSHTWAYYSTHENQTFNPSREVFENALNQRLGETIIVSSNEEVRLVTQAIIGEKEMLWRIRMADAPTNGRLKVVFVGVK